MGIMNWFKGSAGQPEEPTTANERGDLTADLKLERLRRAIIDFPGRSEGDLARMIYGRDEPSLVAAGSRKLEADGIVVRDPETGGLYAARR